MNEKCQDCGEMKRMVLEDVKAVRHKNGSEVLIKNVPTETCDCSKGSFQFRVVLEMGHYKENDDSNESEVDYQRLRKAVEGMDNFEIMGIKEM
ncbi:MULTISPECIES: hypothetical protein [Allobacillus]|uniref:Uncharacterized protein n=1 Tax=Allobacillus salarius TaxID=1955272 RepID=A0A556PPH4_9BACI|nr:hypothetical protein [Allobacillus salarius]TSJ66259.1 hypothetical protein FPQ13_05175 [Allobacillus salarius]